MNPPTSGTGKYLYPDPSDRVTARMIETISDNKTWSREEGDVLGGFAKAASELPRPRSLLDLGAGEGRVFWKLSRLFDLARLVEPDQQRRAILIERAVAVESASTIEIFDDFRHAGTDSHDVVMLNHVIQHIPRADVSALVLAAARQCRSQGLVFVMTTMTKGDHEYRIAGLSGRDQWIEEQIDPEAFDRIARSPVPGSLPVHFFPREYLEGLLLDGGVELITATHFHHVRAHDDRPEGYRDLALLGRKL